MSNLVTQPTLAPTCKVEFASYAGAIVTVAIFLIRYVDPAFSMPPDVVAAVTTLVAAGVAWYVRERKPLARASAVPAE